MPTATTTFEDGRSTTSAPLPPSDSNLFGVDPSIWTTLLQRRLAEQEADRERERFWRERFMQDEWERRQRADRPGPHTVSSGWAPAASSPVEPRTTARGGTSSRSSGPPIEEQNVRRMQSAAEFERLRAMTEPPPQKVMQGPGIMSGYVPDVNAMNAIQRQLYLPQGAAYAGMLPSSQVAQPGNEVKGEGGRYYGDGGGGRQNQNYVPPIDDFEAYGRRAHAQLPQTASNPVITLFGIGNPLGEPPPQNPQK